MRRPRRAHRAANRRRRAAPVVLATLALLAGALAACGGPPSPQATLSAYLAGWSQGRWAAMRALVDQPPPDFVTVNRSAWRELGVRAASFQTGPVRGHGSTATTALTSQLDLATFGTLNLHSTLRLQRSGGRWLVAWTPATIATGLEAGDRFSLDASWPPRAPVLGAAGASLTPEQTMVTVGLVGQRVSDPATLTQALVAAGLPAATVTGAVAQAVARPRQFVPIETIPEAAYLGVKAQIYPLPGTTFETATAPGTLTPDLSAHIVGHTGPITAQELAQLGAPYTATSVVGQNEIEEVYQSQLAGRPTLRVVIVNPRATVLSVLGVRPGRPGTPVRTTIDPRVQEAAEAALDGVNGQAAIVVLQASTGDVLAAVSRPTDQAFDVALNGSVPPGSTFKVVTSTALLEAGLTPASPATCPPTITIDGKSFSNYEKESVSALSFEQAFAMSCNTAFIGLTEAHLDGSQLAAAAHLYDLGSAPRLGLASFGGSVPTPSTALALAAAAIGQGTVVVSPLDMATIAAAVDSGALHEARLVVAPATSPGPATALPPAVDSALKAMMAQVVVSPQGTAAGAGLPAGTYGKTGTAEFGPGPNPAEDAWFIGFQGDVAFAVFVYGGGVGGSVAAPLAAKLLRAVDDGTG